MEIEGCRCLAHIAVVAGETFTLPQHIEQLIGLVYLHTGSGILLGREDGSVALEAQSAALYPGWEQRRLTACEDSALVLAAFRCGEPEEVLAAWERADGPARDCRSLPGARHFLPQLDALSPAPEQAPGVQPATQLLLSLLGQSGRAEIPAYLQAMRHTIETRYGEDITLEMLSAQVGKSKFHLSRAFREYYQMTPGAYLTTVRLSRAAELLTTTALPVREIGRLVGFANNAYFTARFKEKYGRPPREYRLMGRRPE